MDEEKIKPTSTAVEGAQSQQRLGKQAKAIMDEFVKALDKVGELTGEAGIEREESTRKGKVQKADDSFTERMLKNAPRKEDSYILAEKKRW